MNRNEIKSRYRDKKLETVLETPLTRILKWLRFAWDKFVVQWGVPRYTLAAIFILNGIGLLFNVIGYWMPRYSDKEAKTFVDCFKYILKEQLPWNIQAFTYIFSFAFWIAVIAIPFIIAFALFAKKK